MGFNHTLSAVLRGRWLIDQQWATDHLPLVLMMLQGKPVNLTSSPEKKDPNVKSTLYSNGYEEISQPVIIDPSTFQQYPAYIFDRNNYQYLPNPNIPPNSVAIIPVSGPITKYNGDCGEAGSMKLADYINEMGARANIGSIVFSVDTPGGESRAASAFVSALKNNSKPTLSFIHGMSASLGVWLTSATDEVYLSDSMNTVGSVGSYCTLFDFSGYLEQNGIKMIEIYAPQSTDKNKVYRDAIAGDASGIEAELKMMVDQFISFVKDNRGDKAAANVKAWSTGKMFYAQDAVNVGLADGIKTFEQVVSKAAWLSKRKK